MVISGTTETKSVQVLSLGRELTFLMQLVWTDLNMKDLKFVKPLYILCISISEFDIRIAHPKRTIVH